VPLIVLCFDRLPTSLLGPYGNTLFSTPAFDDLAATGLTLEYAFRSHCQTHPLSPVLEKISIPGSLWIPNPLEKSANQELSDQLPQAFELMWAPEESDKQETTPARKNLSDWTDTQQAKFFQSALEGIDQFFQDRDQNLHQNQPLIWIDMPALSCHWDAPEQWKTNLLGEEETLDLETFCPNTVVSQKEWDPDFIAGVQAAAGAQAMLIDHCLDSLLAAADSKHCDLLVTSKEGFSFGEHGQLGPASNSSHAEQTQVPLFYRPAGGMKYGVRIPGTQQSEVWLGWLIDFATNPSSPTLQTETSGTLGESEKGEPNDGSDTDATITQQNTEEENQERDPPDHNRLITNSILTFGWTRYSLFASRFRQVQQSHQQSAKRQSVDTGNLRNTAISFGQNPAGQAEVFIRTDNWSYRWVQDENGQKGDQAVFVRPEDKLELSDISTRVPNLLEQFGENADRLLKTGLDWSPLLLDRSSASLPAEPMPGQEQDGTDQDSLQPQQKPSLNASQTTENKALKEETSAAGRDSFKKTDAYYCGDSFKTVASGANWTSFPGDFWRPLA